MSFSFPSDQHVALVGVTLLGLGLCALGFRVTDSAAVTACVGGVVALGSGMIGFLGGKIVGRGGVVSGERLDG